MAASAPYARRSFAGGGITTTVPLGIPSAGQASFALASTTNWPSGASGTYFVVLDRGLTSEEKCEVTSLSGSTLTIAQRGADGSTAAVHASGCTITLCHVARDDDEANQVAVQTLGTVQAVGDLLYASSVVSNAVTFSRLAIGGTGALLEVTAGAPAWLAAGAGNSLLQIIGGVPTWSAIGYGLAAGAPAVTLTNVSGHISSPVNIGTNTATKIMDTASLDIGVWLVNMTALLDSGTSDSAANLWVVVDTATATFEGVTGAEIEFATINPSTVQANMSITFIATVTVAGTLKMMGEQTGAGGGNALVTGNTIGNGKTTGYTAVRLS